MSRRLYYVMLTAFAALGLCLTLFQGAQAQGDDQYAPNWTSYQGYLTDSNGDPMNGQVDLYFALYDEGNGGNKDWSEYHDNVEVNNGYFYAMLGGDNAPTGHWDYADDKRYMEVRVCGNANCSDNGEGNGWETMPRQQVGAVPYAMRAHRAYSAEWASNVKWDHIDGVPADLGGGYKYYVTVAKEGGDYTSLYDAMQSIDGNEPTKPYVIYVAPGHYEETQTINAKQHVTIKGAGKYATLIYNRQQNKTLVLNSDVTISDISFENRYQGGDSYAIYAQNAAKNVYLDKVRAEANYNYNNNYGSADYSHYGIYLSGSNIEVHANYLYAYGRYAKYNYGGLITNGAAFYPSNSHFYGQYGYEAYGLRNQGNGSYLEAYYIKAYGKYARDYNYGLYNRDRAEAKLNKGYYRGEYGGQYNYGDECYGIYNRDAYVTGHYIYAYGYQCNEYNYGLYNYYDNYETNAWFYYSYFQGYKGYYAYGIYNYGNNAHAYLDGSYGYGDGSTYSDGGAAQGRSYGFYTMNGGMGEISGGYYRGDGGYACYGVAANSSSGSEVKSWNTEAYARNCANSNYGLYASGGASSYCDNCYAWARDNGNYGAYVDNGTMMYVGNSKLDNGSGNNGWGGGGTLNCYGTYQYNYNGVTCSNTP